MESLGIGPRGADPADPLLTMTNETRGGEDRALHDLLMIISTGTIRRVTSHLQFVLRPKRADQDRSWKNR